MHTRGMDQVSAITGFIKEDLELSGGWIGYENCISTYTAEDRDCSDFIQPACEHGIGLFGDEWRIGSVINPDLPYWTDQDHIYQENKMVVCAMQYVAPEEKIGFRYENDIVIQKDGCEVLSKYPLGIEEIQ